MHEQVDSDFSLLESIRHYLLDDDHSDNFFNNHNQFGFPRAVSEESSINIHTEMSSIFPRSRLNSPHFVDELNDSLPNLQDFEISGLLNDNSNDIFPVTNPATESGHGSVINKPLNWDFTTGNNIEDVTFERKYRGVRQRSCGKFTAQMRNPEKKGSRLWLGTYDTPEDAAMAYDRAAFKHRGSHALLNFPLLINSHNEISDKYITKKQSISSTSSPSSSSSLSGSSRKRSRSLNL